MKKQIVVIGLGRFGISIAKSLFNMGNDVLALDSDAKNVESIASEITHAVQADATNEAVLRELGIGNFDVGIVAVGQAIQNSVLATILLKKLGVPYVIARAENDLHGSILEKIGADKVVYVEWEMGAKVAHGVALRGMSDYIEVAPTYGIVKLTAPQNFTGKMLSDLEFGRAGKWGVTVLLIRRGKEVIVTPSKSEIINAGDIMAIAGSDEKLEQMLIEVQKR